MSAKSRRSGKTAEERTAEARVLQETLTAQVEELAASGEWTRFLRFMASFHTYSLNNLLLILAQCPHASAVAGFRAWQAKGRQVRKGESAIKIRGFSTFKTTQTDTVTGEETEHKIPRYPILSVFDFSQTDQIPGAEVVDPVSHLTGEDHLGIYEAMAAHIKGLGWAVTREQIPGSTNGYTTMDGSKRIVVDAHLAPAQAAKTMLHEAGHAILHADEEGKRGEAVPHQGIRECEAESVAYVLAGLVGLDTSAYSVGYVAGWTKGDTVAIAATAGNVLRAVTNLAPALFAEEDQARVDTTAA